MLAEELVVQPGAIEFFAGDGVSRLGCVGAQVSDVIAIHVVLAHGQRLQSFGEALGELSEGGHHVEREVERWLAAAVESAASEGSAGAGERGEGPGWIVGAVASADKPQANPPRAKWSRYSLTAWARPDS